VIFSTGPASLTEVGEPGKGGWDTEVLTESHRTRGCY
jgi:hypothetical protein